MSAGKLRVEGLVKRYGDRVVLDGIDLSVDEHQVVCLIGPSGSGKSTLLRCIDLLEPIDGGRVLLDGEDITAPGVNANSIRRRIGIVFQSFNLFPHMRVLDNVTLGPRKAAKVPKAEAEARAMELLDRLAVAEHAQKYPEQLSGGQQQRVALARSLVADPEILLLDEVTSALDPELVGEVLSAIRSLAAEGMTIVMATHEMGFAREVAHRIDFLHEGRVLESGPPSQLLKDPTQERTRQFLKRVIEAGRL
ncbi:MAG: binding-protein-dependent transporter ATP-binding protein [Ilumatobacteraceae bacterium]|nr:binding-protein-dependent transporter ATP-binding protein [Ilumatobacteraceae bacterium]